MQTVITILSIVVFAIIVLVLYNVLKTFVLSKIKVNKWIVLAIAIIFFMVPMVIWPDMPKYVANYIIPGIFVILLLWFMDLSGFMKNRTPSKTNSTRTYTKRDKKDDIVIKPKAKPNRVKNNK